MTTSKDGAISRSSGASALSLYHLLDPAVLANPYPLFHRLRTEDPVHWDPFLHTWVVTRYPEVLEVLHKFSADRRLGRLLRCRNLWRGGSLCLRNT